MGNCLPKSKHATPQVVGKNDRTDAKRSNAVPSATRRQQPTTRPARARESIPDADAASPEELEKRKEKARRAKLKLQQQEDERHRTEEAKEQRRRDGAAKKAYPPAQQPTPQAASPPASPAVSAKRGVLRAVEVSAPHRRSFLSGAVGSDDNDFGHEKAFQKLLNSLQRATHGAPHLSFAAGALGRHASYDSVSEGYYGSVNNYVSVASSHGAYPSDRGYGNGAGGFADSDHEYISDHDFPTLLKHVVDASERDGAKKSAMQRRKDAAGRRAELPPVEGGARDGEERNYYSNDRRRMLRARQEHQRRLRARARAAGMEGIGMGGHSPNMGAAAQVSTLLGKRQTEVMLGSFASHPALMALSPLASGQLSSRAQGHPAALLCSPVPAIVADVRLHPRLAKGTSSAPLPRYHAPSSSLTAGPGMSASDASATRPPGAALSAAEQSVTDRDDVARTQSVAGMANTPIPLLAGTVPGACDRKGGSCSNCPAVHARRIEEEDEEDEDTVELPAKGPEFEVDVNLSFHRTANTSSTAGDDMEDLISYYGDDNDDSAEDLLQQERMQALGYKLNDTNNDECYQVDQHHVAPFKRGDVDEAAMKLARRQQDAHVKEDSDAEDGQGEQEHEEERSLPPHAAFAASFPGTGGGHCLPSQADDVAHRAAAAPREEDHHEQTSSPPPQPTQPPLHEERAQPARGAGAKDAAAAPPAEAAMENSPSAPLRRGASLNSIHSVATERHHRVPHVTPPGASTPADSRRHSTVLTEGSFLSPQDSLRQETRRHVQDRRHTRTDSIPFSDITVATTPAGFAAAAAPSSHQPPPQQRQQQRQEGGASRAQERLRPRSANPTARDGGDGAARGSRTVERTTQRQRERDGSGRSGGAVSAGSGRADTAPPQLSKAQRLALRTKGRSASTRSGANIARNARGRADLYRGSAEYRSGGGMFFVATSGGDREGGGGYGGSDLDYGEGGDFLGGAGL